MPVGGTIIGPCMHSWAHKRGEHDWERTTGGSQHPRDNNLWDEGDWERAADILETINCSACVGSDCWQTITEEGPQECAFDENRNWGWMPRYYHHTWLRMEVFTMPPYSTWNPCGIYVESMLFHMESAYSTWNMFWLRSHPFWWFSSTYILHGMGWIPCGFHHSIWNFHMDSTWNLPHEFHPISMWIPCGFHVERWIPGGIPNNQY